ncbi:MAG: rod shape-determining protein MreD [Gilvibacter sp.]
MNNEVLKGGLRFVILVALQIFLINNIALFGYVTPYIYILFILLYPINSNRELFLVLCFVLGFTIDVFENSGGIHAAACLCMGYLRPLALKTSFGVSYEYNTIKINDMPIGGRITYVVVLVLVHHLILFGLEIFDLDHTLLLLKTTVLGVLFSSLLILAALVMISSKSR